MSNNVTTPSGTDAGDSAPVSSATQNGSPESKGKGKAAVGQPMEDEEDEDEEEEEGEEDEDEEMDEEDDLEEIDPGAILASRRTRGVKVDYTSKEALEKAGLNPETAEEDEDSYAHDDMED